jgi:uncharacterized protein (TIGR01777 family)
MATVLISGGSGLVGKHLGKSLQERGFDIILLSRSKKNKEHVPSYLWDLAKGEIDSEAIASADYIIHLSGANIGEKRWTPARKEEIKASRINSGQLILDEVKRQNKNLQAFISASATGYYGSITSREEFGENHPPGEDFLGQICSDWEKMADRFKDEGIRTVKIRTGVVLTREGGALAKMAMPIKFGLAAALGNGKQFLPWIHIEDLCGIYIRAVEDAQMSGAYNAVAPEQLTNREFTRALAKVFNKTLWLPNVPAFVLKIVFGKMSEILLQGSRVSSDKIQKAGYRFSFPHLNGALKNLLQ